MNFTTEYINSSAGSEWLASFQKRKDIRRITSALKKHNNSDKEFEIAVCAAVVAEALNGNQSDNLPKELSKWSTTKKVKEDSLNELKTLSQEVLSRIEKTITTNIEEATDAILDLKENIEETLPKAKKAKKQSPTTKKVESKKKEIIVEEVESEDEVFLETVEVVSEKKTAEDLELNIEEYISEIPSKLSLNRVVEEPVIRIPNEDEEEVVKEAIAEPTPEPEVFDLSSEVQSIETESFFEIPTLVNKGLNKLSNKESSLVDLQPIKTSFDSEKKSQVFDITLITKYIGYSLDQILSLSEAESVEESFNKVIDQKFDEIYLNNLEEIPHSILKSLGEYIANSKGNCLLKLELDKFKFDNSTIAKINYFKGIQRLKLSTNLSLPDETLSDFSKLEELSLELKGRTERIDLSDFEIPESIKYLEAIGNISSIDYLCDYNIEHLKICGALFENMDLATLPEDLTRLELYDTKLKKMISLEQLTKLKTLILSDIRGVDVLTELYSLTTLENLVLHELASLNDILPFVSLENLKFLSLNFNHYITDISVIARMKSLETIILSGMPKVKGIPNLKVLENLKKIHLEMMTGIREYNFLSESYSLEEVLIGFTERGIPAHAFDCIKNIPNLNKFDLRNTFEESLAYEVKAKIKLPEPDEAKWINDHIGSRFENNRIFNS